MKNISKHSFTPIAPTECFFCFIKSPQWWSFGPEKTKFTGSTIWFVWRICLHISVNQQPLLGTLMFIYQHNDVKRMNIYILMKYYQICMPKNSSVLLIERVSPIFDMYLLLTSENINIVNRIINPVKFKFLCQVLLMYYCWHLTSGEMFIVDT